MDIKISCIIPYYNVEKELLTQCINSILQQDFQDYEILVVDDGSDKIHAACLQDICSLDKRIQVISQPNLGVSVARNVGVKNASGEYVTFVDADDLILPYFFSEAYQIAVENDAEYVIGGTLSSQLRNLEITRRQNPDVEVRDSVQYIPFAIKIIDKIIGGGYFNRGPVAKLIKRSVLVNVFFPENLKFCEDNIWNLDVISKCSKVFIVYQVWYIYWKNPASVSHKYNDQIVCFCEKYLIELFKRVDLKNEKEAIAVSYRIFELLKKHIYYCYLGCKECPLPLIKRFKIFREICKREPWTEYSNELFLKSCDIRVRIKQIFVKSGMIYWYWFAKDLFKRNKQR